MGSSAKTGKFFIRGSQERKRCTFLGPKHKSAICDRTPLTYTPNLVYMCAGQFRGPKSSNRIELSRLVQDLLNFGDLGSLWLWGRGRWVGGVLGHLGAWGLSPCACICTHMHTHTCMHMYTCIEIANDCRHGGIHVYHVYHV